MIFLKKKNNIENGKEKYSTRSWLLCNIIKTCVYIQHNSTELSIIYFIYGLRQVEKWFYMKHGKKKHIHYTIK